MQAKKEETEPVPAPSDVDAAKNKPNQQKKKGVKAKLNSKAYDTSVNRLAKARKVYSNMVHALLIGQRDDRGS